jgi:hypothetical protein
VGRDGRKRINYPAFLPRGLGLARLESTEGAVAVTEFQHVLLRFVPLLVLLVAILLILRETRHGIANFAELIRAAWADEWHGKERVAKCNRGGTVISFTITTVIFLTQQAHSLLGSRQEGASAVIWLFISCMAFLVISLLVLANLERQKMLYDRRRRAPTRR